MTIGLNRRRYKSKHHAELNCGVVDRWGTGALNETLKRIRASYGGQQ